MKAAKQVRGFTLIELMLVVAILGILGAIAIPKFAEMIRKSNEGYTLGQLGAIRSALNIYYGDMEGLFPSNFLSLTINAKYLSTIPAARTPRYHQDLTNQSLGSSGTAITEVGGWAYVNVFSDHDFGTIMVNCTHTDLKSSVWSSY